LDEFGEGRKITMEKNTRRPSASPAKHAWDLEERLLEFSASIVRLAESLPKTRSGSHIGGQLLRSGTSPLLNHAEAEAAESRQDFVHKLRISLKELRETLRCLKLIQRVPLVAVAATLAPLIQESDELIRIFTASVRTAARNAANEKRTPNI
jgi:four helix bundle protein